MFSHQQHCTPQCRKWLRIICSMCMYHKSVLLYAFFSLITICKCIHTLLNSCISHHQVPIHHSWLLNTPALYSVGPKFHYNRWDGPTRWGMYGFPWSLQKKRWDGSLRNLFGHSPISIIILSMYRLFTSFHSTILYVKQLLVINIIVF